VEGRSARAAQGDLVIASPAAEPRRSKGPFNVKDGDALEKFFVKECVGDGKPSPKIFGTPLKHD